MDSSWALEFLEECSSTNDYVRNRGDWHAVCARTQTAGRGRQGRSWVSDDGGVWLSAVVPAPQSDPRWKMLPLAAGFAVASTIRALGAASVRLRWPNDVMVQSRKCAGILVDRFHPERCVVGIGVNVRNHPESSDPTLQGQTVRLSDLLAECPSRQDLVHQILQALRVTVDRIAQDGASRFNQDLSAFWDTRLMVRLESGTFSREGQFCGVDDQGRIRFRSLGGALEVLDVEHIQLLRETGEGHG